MMSQLKQEQSVNVLETVVGMRKQRTMMVQTMEQYVYLHKLLAEVSTFGTTAFPTNQIGEKMASMRRKGTDGLDGFETEYRNLGTIGPIDELHDIAERPANVKFNRYPGIVPYNRARLILPPIRPNEPPAYYNASLIMNCDGFNGSIICAQSPLYDQTKEFWFAVWNYDVTMIVMVTDLVDDNGKEQCSKYWPDYPRQSVKYGGVSVTLVREVVDGAVVTRFMKITQGGVTKDLTQIQYLDWKEHGEPPSVDSVLGFVKVLENSSNRGQAFIHCTDGAGRSGVVVSLVNIIQQIKNQNQIDVFRAVKDLRDYRPNMVNTEEKYRLVYEVCKNFVSGFDLYENLRQ
nr:receptor-type tyrosine-protein phosphatase S-like isoform X1 [Ciona intestinalis]|eukprot:XP_002121408.3 receptor-type tyrosine-protein phosphatase S-like isoform X1 [Ciona intestinalis]